MRPSFMTMDIYLKLLSEIVLGKELTVRLGGCITVLIHVAGLISKKQ